MKSSLHSSSKTILEKLQHPDFVPPRWLKSGLAQTIFGAFWPQNDPSISTSSNRPADLQTSLVEVTLDEQGDKTILVLDKPSTWKSGDRIALLIHGLGGNHTSPYMSRMTAALLQRGILCVRMNLRNCGIAFGKSKRMYHAGLTHDVREVLHWIAANFTGSPTTAIGYSLSGNVIMKLAGEDGAQITAPIDSVVAISPALDLSASSRKLGARPGSWISTYILRNLIGELRSLGKIHPEYSELKFARGLSMRAFDEIMSLRHGFANADDYYQSSSAARLMKDIRVPTLAILSVDDPMLDYEATLKMEVSPSVDLVVTKFGGHVAYVERGKWRAETRWSDDVVLKWLAAAPFNGDRKKTELEAEYQGQKEG